MKKYLLDLFRNLLRVPPKPLVLSVFAIAKMYRRIGFGRSLLFSLFLLCSDLFTMGKSFELSNKSNTPITVASIINSPKFTRKERSSNLHAWIIRHPEDSAEKREALSCMHAYVSRAYDKLLTYFKIKNDDFSKHEQASKFLCHPYTVYLGKYYVDQLIDYEAILYSNLVADGVLKLTV